jgi:P27 family predicted phage terminase small subunit
MPGTSNSGGRNRKSERQHKLEGTFQKVRHAGTVTPTAPVGQPASPKALEGDALEEWDRMVERLTQVGTVSRVDDAALYQYCRLFAETEALAVSQLETMASIDIVEENLHGLKGAELVQCFQEITKLRQLEARYGTQIRQGRMALRQYLVEFGMTPSSRTRVRLPDTQDADPFSEFDDTVQ